MEPYYTAAYAFYKLEYLFRNGQIPVEYKPARYHLLAAARYLAAGDDSMPALTANKVEKYALNINAVLWDDAKALALFEKSASVIDQALNGAVLTREAVKVQAFTDAVLAVVRK